MKVKQCDLKYIGTNFSHYPMDGKPEIAFAGKSNVGKSTLINAILGRKALARTSSQPGKTRTINFYGVNDMMYVVDLPGYGYAKVPKSEVAKWGQMMEEYLTRREELRAIILLIRKTLKLQPQDVLIPFSGEKKTGVEELWAEIEKFLPGGEKAAGFETEAEE